MLERIRILRRRLRATLTIRLANDVHRRRRVATIDIATPALPAADRRAAFRARSRRRAILRSILAD